MRKNAIKKSCAKCPTLTVPSRRLTSYKNAKLQPLVEIAQRLVRLSENNSQAQI